MPKDGRSFLSRRRLRRQRREMQRLQEVEDQNAERQQPSEEVEREEPGQREEVAGRQAEDGSDESFNPINMVDTPSALRLMAVDQALLQSRALIRHYLQNPFELPQENLQNLPKQPYDEAPDENPDEADRPSQWEKPELREVAIRYEAMRKAVADFFTNLAQTKNNIMERATPAQSSPSGSRLTRQRKKSGLEPTDSVAVSEAQQPDSQPAQSDNIPAPTPMAPRPLAPRTAVARPVQPIVSQITSNYGEANRQTDSSCRHAYRWVNSQAAIEGSLSRAQGVLTHQGSRGVSYYPWQQSSGTQQPAIFLQESSSQQLPANQSQTMRQIEMAYQQAYRSRAYAQAANQLAFAQVHGLHGPLHQNGQGMSHYLCQPGPSRQSPGLLQTDIFYRETHPQGPSGINHGYHRDIFHEIPRLGQVQSARNTGMQSDSIFHEITCPGQGQPIQNLGIHGDIIFQDVARPGPGHSRLNSGIHRDIFFHDIARLGAENPTLNPGTESSAALEMTQPNQNPGLNSSENMHLEPEHHQCIRPRQNTEPVSPDTSGLRPHYDDEDYSDLLSSDSSTLYSPPPTEDNDEHNLILDTPDSPPTEDQQPHSSPEGNQDLHVHASSSRRNRNRRNNASIEGVRTRSRGPAREGMSTRSSSLRRSDRGKHTEKEQRKRH